MTERSDYPGAAIRALFPGDEEVAAQRERIEANPPLEIDLRCLKAVTA